MTGLRAVFKTTQTGQLVNQFIPGSGEKVLNFKINLLSTALKKKATLIGMPEDDLLTVEILTILVFVKHCIRSCWPVRKKMMR